MVPHLAPQCSGCHNCSKLLPCSVSRFCRATANPRMLLAIFALVFMATVFLPGPLIVLLIANTLVGLFLSLLQIAITLFPKFRLRRRGKEYRPFVSVLVPAYNEPPLLLIETLEALSRLRYDHYVVFGIE